jgi:hypothetical protein
MYLNFSSLHLLAVTSHYEQPLVLTSLDSPMLLSRTLEVNCPCSLLLLVSIAHAL